VSVSARVSVALNSTDLNPLHYHVCDTMLQKYYKLQPKPKITDEMKVALQTMGRATTRIHQQAGGKLHQVLDWLHDCTWLAMTSICSNSVHLQVCIVVIKQTNRLFSVSQPPYRLLVKTTLGTLRDWCAVS